MRPSWPRALLARRWRHATAWAHASHALGHMPPPHAGTLEDDEALLAKSAAVAARDGGEAEGRLSPEMALAVRFRAEKKKLLLSAVGRISERLKELQAAAAQRPAGGAAAGGSGSGGGGSGAAAGGSRGFATAPTAKRGGGGGSKKGKKEGGSGGSSGGKGFS